MKKKLMSMACAITLLAGMSGMTAFAQDSPLGSVIPSQGSGATAADQESGGSKSEDSPATGSRSLAAPIMAAIMSGGILVLSGKELQELKERMQ